MLLIQTKIRKASRTQQIRRMQPFRGFCFPGHTRLLKCGCPLGRRMPKWHLHFPPASPSAKRYSPQRHSLQSKSCLRPMPALAHCCIPQTHRREFPSRRARSLPLTPHSLQMPFRQWFAIPSADSALSHSHSPQKRMRRLSESFPQAKSLAIQDNRYTPKYQCS